MTSENLSISHQSTISMGGPRGVGAPLVSGGFFFADPGITHVSEQCFLVLFGLCSVRCSGAVRFQTFGGGFLFGGFVRTIGSVREFCSAVLFLFGRSLENVFVL